MPCFDIAQYFWTVKKKAIPKDVVVSDSSPFFDRNSRCFKARNTRTNLRHGKLSPIVVSFGIVAFAFLEIDVKQCRHINGIRDILLLWVPLQHILQLLEKSNYYHFNDWEIILRIFTCSVRLSNFLSLLGIAVSADHWEQW